MSEHFKLLVPGATPAGEVNVTAPFDGEHIATIETGDATAVETALHGEDPSSPRSIQG